MCEIQLQNHNSPIPLYVDNQATVQLMPKSITTKKRKYIDIRQHYLIDQQSNELL